MTGQKNRFTTTEKLWDIDDKQLKTPKHDAMVLWLMDKNNGQDFFYFEPKIHKKGNWDSDIYYTLEDICVESEVPIYANKNFIGGYADLIYYGMYNMRRVFPDGDEEISQERKFNKLIEVKPYIDSFGAVLRQINSYKDMFSTARDYHGYLLNDFRVDEYYIFTLDTRFDVQFESQGIKVLHPPDNITINDMINMYM